MSWSPCFPYKLPGEKENTPSLATVLIMVPKTKQGNRSDLGKQTIESPGAGSMQAPESTWLGRRGGWRTKKGAFIQRNLFLLNICDLQSLNTGGHLARFPHKGEGWVVTSRCLSGLWREVYHPSRRSIFVVLVSLWWKFALLKQKKGGGCALIYRAWVWLQAVN